MEDTQENRSLQADRYLKAKPPTEDFADLTAVIAKDVPDSDRERFLSSMPKNLDSKALIKSYKDLLLKTFTADELKILADFYSHPEAKSTMKKLETYLESTRLPMTLEVRKAMDKTAREHPPIPPPPAPTQK